MNHNYIIRDDGSCIRIWLDGEIVAIVEDFYFAGHVHAAFRQLLEDLKNKTEQIEIYNEKN